MCFKMGTITLHNIFSWAIFNICWLQYVKQAEKISVQALTGVQYPDKRRAGGHLVTWNKGEGGVKARTQCRERSS